MANLMDILRGWKRDRVKAAQKEYSALVRRANEPLEGDAEKLEEVSEFLGLDETAFLEAASIVAEARALVERKKPGAKILTAGQAAMDEAAKELAAAEKSAAAAQPKIDELFRRAEESRNQFAERIRKAMRANEEAIRFDSDLSRLTRGNEHLFGEDWPEVEQHRSPARRFEELKRHFELRGDGNLAGVSANNQMQKEGFVLLDEGKWGLPEQRQAEQNKFVTLPGER